jgi:hypothetical protein
MRVSSYAVSRPAYYDRNASSVSAETVVTAGPHGGTVRFTYTVAAGKKLFLENGRVSIQRQTAAAVAGAYNNGTYIKTGGNNPQYALVESKDNAVQPAATVSIVTGQATIYASEVLECQTSDVSTGGTVYFISSYKATLFDA